MHDFAHFTARAQSRRVCLTSFVFRITTAFIPLLKGQLQIQELVVVDFEILNNPNKRSKWEKNENFISR